MPAVESAAEPVVILERVSWGTYERLLRENDPSPGKRFTYDRGLLQIMVVSRRHELPNSLLEQIVFILTDEWDLDYRHSGSMTFKRKDLKKGFEPDSSFYLGRARDVEGKLDIDLEHDPPPDLVIEVDISRQSLNKFPVFAAVGVPEIWRYRKEVVEVLVLRDNDYARVEQSAAFPRLTATRLTEFVAEGMRGNQRTWSRRVRQWARAAAR